MASEVSICNEALALVGSAPITSLSDANDAARLCARLYPDTLNEVLDAYPWAFAQARVQLSRDATDPIFGYSARFLFPSDGIRVNEVFPSRIEWVREGPYILTNDADELRVRYTKRVDDPSLFSPTFIRTLALKLASKLAFPLTKKLDLAERRFAEYGASIDEARSVNAQESDTRRFEVDDLIFPRSFGGRDDIPLTIP
jgi:hypothetical protein